VGDRRKRLLFVVESSTDVRLVDGLAELFELSVVARTIEGGVEVSHPPAAATPVQRTPSGRGRFAWTVVWEIVARRRDLDFVLVQGYGVGALAANLAGRLARIQTTMLICSPLEEYYLCRKRAIDSKPFRRAELAMLRLVARVNAHLGQGYVVLSRHLAAVVRGHGTRRYVEVCPVYGVDAELFAPSTKKRAELRRELGLPTQGALIFFSSRIAPEKDVDTLLDAVRSLVSNGRDVLLLNASGGHADLAERAARLGLGGRLVAHPAVDPRTRLAAYYQAADLCVQASRAEGLGFAPLEALACGTPVVAADVGGLRETIVEGKTGWTYRPGDAAGLAQAITAALDAGATGQTRIAAGRSLVSTTYDRPLVFERLRSVLDASGSPEHQDKHAAEVGSVV
jgi:glycosyltransferase involved in cell wall biosynthesis